METELKFALAPEARARIEQHARGARDMAAFTDHTTYYDTEGQALRKSGFSLRVRHRLENDSYIQTVKAAGNGNFRRQEWEWPINSSSPDLDRLGEVEPLPLSSTTGPLQPIFRTEVKRTQLTLAPADGSRLELALDGGAVIARNKSEPLSEMEIELKDGSEETLLGVALDLLRKEPLALLNESKAERGYHLMDGSRPGAHKAEAILLDDNSALGDAFRQLADALMQQLLVNQPAVLRGDAREGIHQMRIGLRRLRSLLALFEQYLEPHSAVHFDHALRRLGQVLGEARDWDVFLTETLPCVDDHATGVDWIGPLRALARERQHAAHQAAKKAVLEPAFTRFVLAFQAWSHDRETAVAHDRATLPLEQAAPDMLDRLARKVDRRRAKSDPHDPASLHRLRKSLKKLRYGIEYLQGLYGEKSKRYLKRCNALQKQLGRLNDLENLTRLSDQLANDNRLDLVPALGMLGNRSAALAAPDLKDLDGVAAKFDERPPFW